MSRKFLLLAALAGVLLVAGCGNDATKSGGAGGAAAATGTATPKPPPTAPIGKPPAGGSNAVLPATFQLGPGAVLNPPRVGAPKNVPIVLTIVSHEPQSHQVVVQTKPRSRMLIVPALGRASIRLGILPPATYNILIDGSVHGSLEVGVQPGP